MKISGIYKITNTITGDFYIGSSKNVKRRLANHKCQSTWNKQPNNPMYHDMKNYGIDKFEFQILAEVEESFLKVTEQKFIELLKPTYNNRRANGWNIERHNEAQRKASIKYQKSEKGKKAQKKAVNKYYSQLCYFNNQTLTLAALRMRFKKLGIPHPTQEAKKYLI